MRSTPTVEPRATWGSIASLRPSPTRTARRFRSSRSRSRSSRICRNANPPMTISTESQMAPTRRMVNFIAHDPVPAGRTGSTEGLSEFYPDSTGSARVASAPSPGPELQVLVRCGVGVARDQAEPRLLDPRTDAVQEGELPDRHEDHLLVHELLDLHEDRLAFLPVELRGLLVEEPVDVRVAAVDVRPAGHHERFEPRGGVAERTGGPVGEVLVLLLAPLLEEGRALDRAQLRADPDVLEVVEDRLLYVGVRDIAVVLTGVEPVRVPGFGEEPFGAGGIVRIGRRLPEELERVRDDAEGQHGVPERDGLVDRLPVDGIVGGQAHTAVVPRRLRVPLVEQVDPLRSLDHRRLQREPGRSLELLGQLPADRVDHVDLAALERGQARGLIGDDFEDQVLDARRLAPVRLEGLEHEFHTRCEGHKPIGTGADRRLLIALLAHLLHVLLGHDPAGAGGGRVEGHEVGPRLLEADADPPGVRRLDRRDPVLEGLLAGATVAIARDLVDC